MKNTEEEIAIAIKLPVWQAPNDDISIKIKKDQLNIKFRVLDINGDYLKEEGQLTFINVWSFRFERHKKLHYYPNEAEHSFKSYYLVVNNSKWLSDLKKVRGEYFVDWEKYDNNIYKHFIVQSHKFYVEIIASDVTFG